MAVVVVLPCVPATAIVVLPRESAPCKTARFTVGIPCCAAAASSGFSGEIAELNTTRLEPMTLEAACPTATSTPRSRSASRLAELATSVPLTACPCSVRMRASPDIAAPPTPIRWILRVPAPRNCCRS